MLNPDRVELRLQPARVSENPKKNGYIQRWLRVPAFAIRTSLAVLAAGPGTVIAAELITRVESPYTIYADTLPTPTPDIAATAIAAIRASATAVKAEINATQEARDLQNRITREKRIAELRAEIAALEGTPVPKPVIIAAPTFPPDAIITDRKTLDHFIEEGIKIALTARAEVVTPSPTPASTPIPSLGTPYERPPEIPKSRSGEGVPWYWIPIASLGGAVFGTLRHRIPIIGPHIP